jgi:hypothetical protein
MGGSPLTDWCGDYALDVCVRIVLSLLFGRAGGLRHEGSGARKLGNGCQHFSPMPEKDADFLKVQIP